MKSQLQSFAHTVTQIHDAMERVLAEAQLVQDNTDDRYLKGESLALYRHAQYLRHHIALWTDQEMLALRSQLYQLLDGVTHE